ncbi:MAG TPA: hypothetical protein VE172_04925 [Stackebrandtia sp.]|jgi:polyhydroxyalkanoate synthesis regulator phasin|uniref:phasin family protein n=1 Tax=Stackebrandtia sp. TaxID=2023065 RepID=UPI002D5FEE36|nr:hypothetical protein [Stackebrandtia sp.]HZE38137.1 hypothetical protein [Stackebrandtia sp.]
MQEAWRDYLELALGLTEASRKRAAQVIKSLAEQSGAKVENLQGMAEELLSTSLANRENVVKLVRFELDRALGKVGLATSEEVAELTARVRQLERELKEARGQRAPAEDKPAARKTAAKKTAARKTTAKKTAAKKVVKKSAKKATARDDK